MEAAGPHILPGEPVSRPRDRAYGLVDPTLPPRGRIG